MEISQKFVAFSEYTNFTDFYIYLSTFYDFFYPSTTLLILDVFYMVLFSQIAKNFKENIFISNPSPTFVYKRVSRALRYDRVLH